MSIDEILKSWRQCKDSFTGRKLDSPGSTENEYQGKQWGHPSTYAFVRFDCIPAETLTFEMGGQWPAHLPADYRQLLEDAMVAAIVDTLVAAEYPHIGCAITCTEVKWNDVTSSEHSFYRAAKAAMTALREEHQWSFMTRRK